MKKTILLYILPLLSNLSSVAQNDVYMTLYTPNGSEVRTLFRENELTEEEIRFQNEYALSSFPNAELLENSSRIYNCHSYAWDYSEGGIKTWLVQDLKNNEENLSKYWTDGSYTQTTENDAEKIFYFDGDHSAVVSKTHAGKYESKWGGGPLVRHEPDYVPEIYVPTSKRFYKKSDESRPLYIAGTYFVCESAKYKINNLPSGASVSWSVSPEVDPSILIQNSPAVHECEIINGQSLNQKFTLSANVTFESGESQLFTKEIGLDNDYRRYITGTYFQKGSGDNPNLEGEINEISIYAYFDSSDPIIINLNDIDGRYILPDPTNGFNGSMTWEYDNDRNIMNIWSLKKYQQGFNLIGENACQPEKLLFIRNILFIETSMNPISIDKEIRLVNIYSVNGTLLLSKQIEKNIFDVNSTGLENGLYIIEKKFDDGSFSKEKIMIKN